MAPTSDRGFVSFYRDYVRTALHTATTVGLTALGLLTFVHWGFAIAAITVYVLPPLYLYFSGTGPSSSAAPTPPTSHEREDSERQSDRGAVGTPSENPAPDDESGDDDTDTDSDGDGSDSDSDDGDTDTDSDSDDGDTDDGDTDDDAGHHWQTVVVPTDAALRDVTTTPSATYAVGDGGVVVARREGEWTRLLDDGPAASGASLTGVAATDDGRAFWVAGDGGALGRYDAERGRFTDHSAPADRTDNLSAVAVTGEAGAETVLVANGSGEVLRGRYDGRRLGWADPQKPGSGSSITALAVGAESGYCCDSSGSVFATRDGGATWSRLGVDDAGTFTALAPLDGDRLVVVASDGRLFEYDGSVWTPRRVVDGSLADVALTVDGESGAACGPAGTLADRVDGRWERRLVAADADLTAVAIGPEGAVAVGTDGTVLERERQNR
ncbi:hypothetical protein [Halomarina oriensis]|uniref:Photosynthesis system II assembly factor Ycf48/Hcf136-like domain-containing protein n=1 Tax=Halomarina oriensis TaxID=671145 RepID=A0A6B0GUY8_9EURY|nr:hypothetical protein [Halomarina oriensis]MWG35965.1 hypothetical protein [Halomarina oriensis]